MLTCWKMRILISNQQVSGRTGTETLTVNLAHILKKLGHEPCVYSPNLGETAMEIRHYGIPIIDDIDQLAVKPDIIHGHHSIEAATLAMRFPNTPALFMCHDFVAWHDEAPKLPNIVHYAAVSEGFRSRLTHIDGIPYERTSVILNAVDIHRYTPGPTLPEQAKRALAIAKNHEHIEAITAACNLRGIAIEFFGSAIGKIETNPERLLPHYDLVFASGISALEAMSTGRAVISCDGRGMAGFVNTSSYDHYRSQNFGLPTFTKALTTQSVLDEIDRYDSTEAAAVSQRIRAEASLEVWGNQLISLYETCIRDFQPASLEQWAYATSRFVQRWSPSREPLAWTRERTVLINRIESDGNGLIIAPCNATIPAIRTDMVGLCGFHTPEPWGIWSKSPRYSMRLRPAQPFRRLILSGNRYLPEPRPESVMTLSINGTHISTTPVIEGEQTLTFDFEQVTDSVVWIDISGDEGIAPSLYGSPDTRTLGFGLRSIRLET